jgi:hypothetical protein
MPAHVVEIALAVDRHDAADRASVVVEEPVFSGQQDGIACFLQDARGLPEVEFDP